MTTQQIRERVQSSSFQPTFQYTNNLDEVIDNILKPHEDYFLKLHSKVKEIIEREIKYANGNFYEPGDANYQSYQITFADVCNWQKELFDEKLSIIYDLTKERPGFDEADVMLALDAMNLPNQHITLGLRDINVKVGNDVPPHPIHLEYLKEMCFPINLDSVMEYYGTGYDIILNCEIANTNILKYLTEWYKTFQNIHFFSDLNGRLGGIVINILSYLLTGKYLIKND